MDIPHLAATRRLYYDDTYLVAFEATVVGLGTVGGRPAIALDRSAFYPEGGGQPADRGTLNGLPVVDVQAQGPIVWHILERHGDAAALAPGTAVHGVIDWARRLDHMQQHCGQHLLTAAFIATGGPATRSFHLSDTSVTIDLDSAALTSAQIHAAETLANQVIWEDRPISARFVSAEELGQITLRKAPAVDGPVRVVSIAEFDHSACGGTHPRSTGSVGLIAVLRSARQRGGTRVEFACGGRVLRELRRISAAAGNAAATLSVGIDELPTAVERALEAQRSLAKELAELTEAMDQGEAQRRYDAGEPAGTARIVCARLDSVGLERLRRLAQAIAAQPGGVAILGLGGERAQIVVACAPESGREAQTIVAAGLTVLEGRGGGSATLAQGGGPRGDRLDAALAAMAMVARQDPGSPALTK